MRILVLMTFDIFSKSMGGALENLGHEVHYLSHFNEGQLEETVRTIQPDIAFDMGWDIWHVNWQLEGKLGKLKEILNRYNVFHIYFAEEDWLHFERWSKVYTVEAAPNFILTRAPACVPEYEKMGIPAAYLDVGCNPEFHKPTIAEPHYACDVAVVVNAQFHWGEIRSKSIADLVVPLFDQPFNTKIWGRDWSITNLFYGTSPRPEMIQGELPFTETPKVYSSAKICISVQTCQDQLSNRTYDILSSGGFLLTSDTPAVRQKLHPGVNCAVSNSPEETIRLIHYYLVYEYQRKTIAAQGRQDAVNHFAYQCTLPVVWPQIMQEFNRFRSVAQKFQAVALSGTSQPLPVQEWFHYQTQPSGNGVSFPSGSNNSYMQRYVPVQPGAMYELSVTHCSLGDGGASDLSITVQFCSAQSIIQSLGLQGLISSSSTEWSSYSRVTTTVPPGATQALILINKLPKPADSSVLVSEVNFVQK